MFRTEKQQQIVITIVLRKHLWKFARKYWFSTHIFSLRYKFDFNNYTPLPTGRRRITLCRFYNIVNGTNRGKYYDYATDDKMQLNLQQNSQSDGHSKRESAIKRHLLHICRKVDRVANVRKPQNSLVKLFLIEYSCNQKHGQSWCRK